MRIINNIPAIQSYNALTATNNALAKSIQKLSITPFLSHAGALR